MAEVFPDKDEQKRLDRYRYGDNLYAGDHFEAFGIKGEKDFSIRYRKLRYIAANFAGLMSRVMADMLFSEDPTIDYKEKQNQLFTDSLIQENQLLVQLFESALGNSRRGDSVFKMRIGQRNPKLVDSPNTVILEEVTPAIYFPTLSVNGTRYTPDEEVIATTFKDGDKTYLHKEIHTPGTIRHEVFLYNPDSREIIGEAVSPEPFGFKESEETGIERSLVFHIPNVRDGSGFWGTSDYQDLESLFFALNNRITKVDNILDKHSDPILAVPTGVIDEDGKVRKEALGMFEVDADNPGFNKPEYIVWNANLESAFTQIEALVDMLFMFSEIAPASLGKDKDGVAESGRALKFKLLSTIRKKNRKLRYYDQAVKDMLETAQQLAIVKNVTVGDNRITEAIRPNIIWPDNLINDEVEQTEVVGLRIDQGTMAPSDGIAKLDGISPEEAKAKAKEISDENGPNVPRPFNNLNGGGGTTPNATPQRPNPEATRSDSQAIPDNQDQ